MLIFAHIGLGRSMVWPWRHVLPLGSFLLGSLLPDIIDKPLYYGLSFLTGKKGVELGLISGSRTVGHSLIFLFFLWIVFRMRPTVWKRSLLVGIITHFILDEISEVFRGGEFSPYSPRIGLFFPLYGWRFPIAPYSSVKEHLAVHFNATDLIGEAIGFFIVIWWLWKHEHFQKIIVKWGRRDGNS